MKWCTLQACSFSRHVAAEVRRQARLVLALGGSLGSAACHWCTSLGLGAASEEQCRWLLLLVVRGSHADARMRRFGPAGGQGS